MMPFRFMDMFNRKSRAASPDAGNAALKRALKMHRLGRLQEAREICEEVLRADPRRAECWNLLGVLAGQTGDHERAAELLGKAIALDPANATFFHNRGLALKQQRRLEEAVASYDRAIGIRSGYAEAHASRGLALQELGKLDAAIEAYDRALALAPDFAEAHYNRGNALLQRGAAAAAVASYDRAIAARPDLARAHYNRGLALGNLKEPEASLQSLDAALAIEPDAEFLLGNWLLARMEICDWNRFDEDLDRLQGRIERGDRACPPFAALAMFDSPAVQRRAAATYVQARHPASDVLGPIPRTPRRTRIRVGYFSADFHNHPVSYLTVGVFESHDRSRFEIVGFSLGPATGDEMQRRLRGAFDEFIDAGAMSELQVAAAARGKAIDIAVDLGGHTRNARTGIFAARAAPVQASYIGYLGTLGAPYFDYLFADEILVPRAARAHYSEKIACLPWYQANDSRRAIADRTFTREELGLPASGFVFCCFNSPYKITPAIFSRWMRILDRTPGSALLLYARSDTARSNLRAAATAAGVDGKRIVFADSLPNPEYLARFRAADLFLDTFPYNGGTVVADALWAGLPVLTLMGEAFAARMGASLLHAIGVPELITRSPRDYEERAAELATDPGRLAGMKRKLDEGRGPGRLFDTASFTRGIEAAYAAMYERHQQGLAPDHLRIATARPTP